MSPAGEGGQGPLFLQATLGREPHCKPFVLDAEQVVALVAVRMW